MKASRFFPFSPARGSLLALVASIFLFLCFVEFLADEATLGAVTGAFGTICHQYYSGYSMPTTPHRGPDHLRIALLLCPRCWGLYSGLLLSFLLASLARARAMPRLAPTLLCLGICVTLLQRGLWESALPLVRFGAGLCLGIPLGLALHTGFRILEKESQHD